LELWTCLGVGQLTHCHGGVSTCGFVIEKHWSDPIGLRHIYNAQLILDFERLYRAVARITGDWDNDGIDTIAVVR